MTVQVPEREYVQVAAETVIGTLVVSVKTVYGRRMIYPECNASRLFAQIARTETLTEETLRLVKLLGFEVRTRAQESQVL